MSQNKSDPNVRHILSILQEMASVSASVIHWGMEGNEAQVRVQIDRMRQLTSDLQEAEEKSISYFDTRPDAEKLIVTELVEKIDQSQEFRRAWMHRYKELAPIKALLELEDGPDGILDMSLPTAWDWKYDAIAFTNRSDVRLIHAMLRRGQKRVLVFCAEDIAKTDRIEGVVYFETEKKIEAYMTSLLPGIPKRIYTIDSAVAPVGEIAESEKEVHEKYFDKFKKSFAKAMTNRNTVKLFGNRWLTQSVANLPSIARQPSFRHLLDGMLKLPLVIISPGPSLDKNIAHLKHLKNKAILLAPVQTVMALQKQNIVPDIVMIADPSDMLYLVDGYDMSEVSAVLIGVSCHPKFYKRYQDKIISFNVNGPIDAWMSNIFDDTVINGACGSVSSMAFFLGTLMQCNPMILVGQDLSFSGDKQYSKGAVDGAMDVVFDEEANQFTYKNIHSALDDIFKENSPNAYVGSLTTLPGYYGGTVQSKPDYAMFHTEFERIADANLGFVPPTRLFNCTEGGAYIQGFEHVPLLEAIKELETLRPTPLDVQAIFENIFNKHDREVRFKKLEHIFIELKSALTSSISLAKECHRIAGQVENGKTTISKLSIREKELITQVRSSNFISMAIQDEIRNALKLSESATTLKQNLDASKLLYKLILKETEKIYPVVIASMESFEKMKQECGIASAA
jgi:hypothetical protein